MCDDAVLRRPSLLENVPDWFITQQQVKLWYDDYYHCDNEVETVERYEGYKKRKAQKAQIIEDLIPIAWHPDRMMDWCLPKDEKRLWK